MTIAAKISATELTAQVTNRFADSYFEARLIDASGTTYIPGVTSDASFLAFESPIGTGGYKRAIINWSASDVQAYSDDGVALTQRAAVFAQDGSANTINFSHVALVWSSGNASGVSAVSGAPASGGDGVYSGLLPTSTSGAGVGATFDLSVINGGVSAANYAVSIKSPGYGYSASDTITISNAALQSAGVTTEVTGDLVFSITSVATSSEAGSILSVAQTASPVVVSGGNEAAFYFNLKQFGFNS